MKLEKIIYLFISLLTISLPAHEYIYIHDSWVPIEMEFQPQKERQKKYI